MKIATLVEFHNSLEHEKVLNYYHQLSPFQANYLLKMLLEVHSPIEAIDIRLQKIRTRKQEMDQSVDGLDIYIKNAEETLDELALSWFSLKSN